MASERLQITEFDFRRLRKLLEAEIKMKGVVQPVVRALLDKLESAEIVSPLDIPSEVITLNTRFRMRDLDTGGLADYVLVFPRKADIWKGRISVLAPVGAAILGSKEQDTVSSKAPMGKKKFRIERIIFQPEAAEAFHL